MNFIFVFQGKKTESKTHASYIRWDKNNVLFVLDQPA
jgi:hypothetical protein